MRTIRPSLLSLACACALLTACSDDSSPERDTGPGSDAAVDAAVADAATGPGLSGTVKDEVGEPVQGVMLEVGSEKTFTAEDGSYTLLNLTPGEVTVKLTQEWFQDKSETVTVKQSEMTTLDVTIQEQPLKLEPADKTLADSYNASFDWTTDKLSITILAAPTRVALDNAVYHRNPALYRDTAGENAITPSPQPTISGTAQNFSFPTDASKEAVELTSIVDSLADTPLTATEKEAWMMWKPMFTWLLSAVSDTTQLNDMSTAGAAVRQQNWGDANAVRPQDIEQVFLHNGELWVQVVFEDFVQLGAGITDSDGDGRKEIYAKLAPEHYSAAITDKLKNDYLGQAKLNTHHLSKEINESLNELYTTTAAEVLRYIGQSFEVTGVGTISYPLVVLKHADGSQNVLLVGP